MCPWSRYIKEAIDAARGAKGQYLLTGSQNLMLMEQVTESLAGRTAVFLLLPLSFRETAGKPEAGLPWEASPGATLHEDLSGPALWMAFLRGGFPELWAEPEREPSLWHAGYLQTYLERDVRQLRHIGDLSQFQVFLRALAARSAQLFNATDLGRDLGIATNTVRAWLLGVEVRPLLEAIETDGASSGQHGSSATPGLMVDLREGFVRFIQVELKCV